MLQTNPQILPQLRQRLAQSGLSEDEIRDRMRAAGYPDDLIDQILQGGAYGGTGGSGTGMGTGSEATGRGSQVAGTGLQPSGTNELGQADDAERIAAGLLREPEDPLVRDSLRADSLGKPWSRPLRVFGLDVFQTRNTQFLATRAGPVPDSYRLGPGDRLAIALTGDVQRSYTLEVNRDGMMIVPQAGELYVANLSLGAATRQLVAKLGQVYSGVGAGSAARTRVSVTLTRVRTVQIFVTGEVRRPGTYMIAATGDALTALYAAGGPTASGSFRALELRRNGQLVDTLDLYAYLLGGLRASGASLENGDVIFVPLNRGRVKVAGRVARPAIYEVTAGETLRDAIQFAGGFAVDALRQRVQIHRILPPDPRDTGRSRVVIDVGPDQFEGGVVPAVAMAPGDSVSVFEAPTKVRGYVTISGDVWVEGVVGFRPGMRLSDAIRLAGGPKPDVYPDQILVSRLRSDSTRIQLRSAFADSSGRVAQDLALEEEDEIQIFSKSTFRPDRYVVVTGAVRSPGRIRYREGMTVRDVILLANGLTEDAFLKEAEIARVPEDRSRGQVSSTIRVQLDSTYLFARTAQGTWAGPPGIPAPAAGMPEVPLQPYDNVLILRQPEWELPRTVKITGQVKYPGPYALRTKTERLSDLIQRAGGLTPEAYADGIAFTRQQDSAGRVGIDLQAVLKNPHHRDNLILAAGDSIFIPEFEPTVLVRGAVNAPGAVAYEPGRNIDWYVRAAGGFDETGDQNHTYVVQPNGEKETVQRRFLVADAQPKPRPGAVVVVPVRKLPPRGSPAGAIAGIAAQLLAALATIIAVTK